MEQKIIEIIARILKVDTSEVELDTAIGDLDEWDSLHHIQIIVEIENTYNIKFNHVDLAELEDVSDLIALAERMYNK
jgi:acyl carrier protein